jgi:hypothetical protein
MLWRETPKADRVHLKREKEEIEPATAYVARTLSTLIVLPPFRNIRCFSFVKLIYLDIF